LFTQIIANAVVEAESETGLKIIETLQEDEGLESEEAKSVDDEEEVEVDPASYEAVAEVAAASVATQKAASGEAAVEEPIVEEDKYYAK